ncbi:Site-specific DNA recombinase [Modestobacter sp. DSM 44400]|uniref:recombinase family protein n=1 Tax=Modestobacter sp. DSM 44400 TaxID=1550230 RepID=UPI0008945F64|nr:recombinase family protein [Modestobacter sp. DSM 44400]SDY15378.1 Site-specific DNA recombinase [Modestobacter sp. DSM 44400]
MNVVAYLRVSTREQADTGHGLDAQRHEILSTASARGWAIVAWTEDAGVSGGHLDRRAGWLRAIELVESGQADAIVASKIDRVSRSVADFAALVDRAQTSGWALIILDIGLDLTTPMGRFTAHVLSAAAQLERDMIKQRTRDGLAAARSKGIKLGRPRSLPEDVAHRVIELRASGATLAAIADRFNAEGVPTARGGSRWHPATVRAVLTRAA